ncbi:transposase [Pseudogracilibacillus auburnensis]
MVTSSKVRRHERVILIFPNQQSAFRLVGSVLMDYEEVFSSKVYIQF